MNKIKFLKANTVTGIQKIQLNGLTYKPQDRKFHTNYVKQ